MGPADHTTMDRIKPIKIEQNPVKQFCKHCRKLRGHHKASTLECPGGSKTRIGYVWFIPNTKFEPREKKR